MGDNNELSPLSRWDHALSWFPALTPAEKAALVVICHRINMDAGVAWPSHQRIAEDAGLSVGGVRKAIAKLEKRGAIIVMGSGGMRRDEKGQLVGIANRYRMGSKYLPTQGQVPTCPGMMKYLPRNDEVPAPEAASTCPPGDEEQGKNKVLNKGENRGGAPSSLSLSLRAIESLPIPDLGADTPSALHLAEVAGLAHDTAPTTRGIEHAALVELYRRAGVSLIVLSAKGGKVPTVDAIVELAEASPPAPEQLGIVRLQSHVAHLRKQRNVDPAADDLQWLKGHAVFKPDDDELKAEWRDLLIFATPPLIVAACDMLRKERGKAPWPSEVRALLDAYDPNLLAPF